MSSKNSSKVNDAELILSEDIEIESYFDNIYNISTRQSNMQNQFITVDKLQPSSLPKNIVVLNMDNDNIEIMDSSDNSEANEITLVSPETPKKSINNLEALLQKWNQSKLINNFKSQGVDIEALKVIQRHHLPGVLKDFDCGTLIKFEHKLSEWRESIGIPLLLPNYLPSSESAFTKEQNQNRPDLSIPLSECLIPQTNSSNCEVSLSKILRESPKGIIIKDIYQKQKKFQDQHRSLLVNMVAQYFIDNIFHLDLGLSYRIEREIIEIFPTEQLEFYRTGKRGKIYNKFCNLKISLRNIVGSLSPKEKKNEVRENKQFKELDPEENAAECIKSLKFDNLDSAEFDHCWKGCTQFRLNEIKASNSTSEILQKWPQYKNANSQRLIDMDFNFQYVAGSLIDNWQLTSGKIIHFLCNEQHVKEKQIKDVLKNIQSSDLTENSRDAAILWALHGYLIPTQKSIRRDNQGRKKSSKFSIKDSQESFVFVGECVQAVEEHIQFLKGRSENVQPFIAAIGSNILNITDIYIYFDGIKFSSKSFIRAVDICFKIFYLFNLEYPAACIIFWNFIQNNFYNLKTNKLFPRVQLLIEELKNESLDI